MTDLERSDSDIEQAKAAAASAEEVVADSQETAEERARREARRRILMGGLASAPLILTLTSRPAMGGSSFYGGGTTCSISGKLSGNASHAHTDSTLYCRGKEPGYWKVNGDTCKQYFNPGPCNPIYQTYYGTDDYSVPTESELLEYREKLQRYSWNWYKIWQVDQYLEWLSDYPGADETPPFGTSFAEIFGSGIAQDSKLTLMQALWLDDNAPYPPSGMTSPSPLLAHIAAAYCNACEYGKDYYGLSPYEVVEKVQQEIHYDPYTLEEHLRILNSQG